MNAQQGSSGLGQGGKLKRKRSKKGKSAASRKEPTTKARKDTTSKDDVHQKELEAVEPSDERAELIAEYEALLEEYNALKCRSMHLDKAIKERKENDPHNGPAAEKLQEILANRYKAQQLLHVYKVLAARCDEAITNWAGAIEDTYAQILEPIAEANQAIIDAGCPFGLEPIDLSGAPKTQGSTTATDN